MKKILSFLFDSGRAILFVLIFGYALYVLFFLHDISTFLILILLLVILVERQEVYNTIHTEYVGQVDVHALRVELSEEKNEIKNKKKKKNTPKK